MTAAVCPAATVRLKPLLSVQGVSLSFGSKLVLREVTIAVDDLQRTSGEVTGQIVAFLGPSGIGKSQLLRIIAGLQKPTAGQVLVGEKQEPVRPGSVGMVSQQYRLYPNRTVVGNLMVAAQQKITKWYQRFDPIMKSHCMRECVGIMDQFGLISLGNQYPSQLSGGQRQRVAIAQQLLCSEHFILLDEPTTGLDPISKQKVCDLIVKVANQDELNTVILVTHDIQAAVAIADTIWVMGRDHDEKGQILPGARIVKTYDLIQRGLCWHPEIRKMPEYAALVEELQDQFGDL